MLSPLKFCHSSFIVRRGYKQKKKLNKICDDNEISLKKPFRISVVHFIKKRKRTVIK